MIPFHFLRENYTLNMQEIQCHKQEQRNSLSDYEERNFKNY